MAPPPDGNGVGSDGGRTSAQCVQELEDPLRTGHGALQDVELFAQVADGLEEAFRILKEGHQRAQGQDAVQHAAPSVPENQGDGQGPHQVDHGIEYRVVEDGLNIGL